MLIHTRNEHPDMQANKLNAKYHLHVQHSTDTKTQSNCIKDTKSNKGTRVMYLKKCITLTASTKLQSMGTKHKVLILNIILINIGLFYLLFFTINTPALIKLFLPLSSYSSYHHHLPPFILE